MLRITGGSMKGRKLAIPPGSSVRPTSERVREAVFSILEAKRGITEHRVLDLYAGTGALGIEALSRGARAAVFVEQDRTLAEALRRNLEILGIYAEISVLEDSVERVLARGAASLCGQTFDLVFADPPYDRPFGEDVLSAMTASGFLAPGALILLERSRRIPLPCLSEGMRLKEVSKRFYGETVVLIYEYN